MHGDAVVVRSAGLECGAGLPAAGNAVTVMAARGVDISRHCSTDIEGVDVREFDVIVALSPAIGSHLKALNPKRLVEWNVFDPYRGDLARYRAAADAIDAALKVLVLGLRTT